MLDTLLRYDKELFLFLNGLGTAGWDGFWMALTNKWTSIPLYLILLLLSLKALGMKKTLVLLISVALLITATDQLTNFFKLGVGRLRPCFEPGVQEYMRLVKGSCGGRFGFYSAHASNAMGVAIFFTLAVGPRFRWLGPVLIIWALAVAYSRIYIGVHYPLDVLAGVATGLLMGWLFARLFTFALQQFRL